MARRKKGRAVDGWLVLDKPYDMGSTEAVSKLRWLFDAQKAGHAGTLDPLATGILPIAFGEATKTVSFIQDGLKTYRFTARWGASTTTDDLEGDVLETSDHRPSKADILDILPEFTGTIEQRPPAFSAIKIDGERAYDLARDGEAVVPPAREVTIHSLRLVDCTSADEAVFEAVTGKGTYVRAVVRDMAEALGTRAHVSALRRTAVGPFTEDMAVTFEELTGRDALARLEPGDRNVDRYDDHLTGIEQAMTEYPSVSIGRSEAARLSSGGAAILPIAQVGPIRNGQADDIEPVLAMEGDRPIALCRLEGLKLLPTKVFNIGGH
ncbi:tRNA pseudouridine(55) synthase TruB [Parvularcula sp. LCG005]|uniref:tRNA pseudouridine(55) synthase TruB n=1 Tax=Parvularcula sp. LCG005 TaxID=3078805 RepID=UPI002942CCB4|nr:tRNA pseudouridine(55) synthase TruB [Parvularcula sp. LCG005]WOI53128.1 tRNA pseudouridine(55) synthase TruB [Parvularcula sp. LCG005]